MDSFRLLLYGVTYMWYGVPRGTGPRLGESQRAGYPTAIRPVAGYLRENLFVTRAGKGYTRR